MGNWSIMPAAPGATATGDPAGAVAVGMPVSGCVFFICTEAGAGAGSGNTATRAVSFLGLTGWGVNGDGVDATFAAGTPGFAVSGTGGGTDRTACTGLLSAGGINGLATGGRGVPAPGVFGARGGFAGGRVGKAIRTVSRASGDCAAGGGA
jgi:hypothetical protein